MGRHRNQVAALALRRGRDLGGGVAPGQHTVRADAIALHRRAQMLEVLAVGADLLRLAEVELAHVAGGKPIGDVYQHDLGAAKPGEAADVVEDRRVVRRVLERHEDALVHVKPANRQMSVLAATR
jgi:hypothetical protein